MPSIKLSRRHLLKRAAVAIALPPLDAMFNAQGTLYAADLKRGQAVARPETRFVLWFNGNGITDRYWMPAGTGRDVELTPCLAPLAPYRNDIHVIPVLDNPAGRDRAPPPEMIPDKLFDRIFGKRDEGWINRKQSILDAILEDSAAVQSSLGYKDQVRLDEHLSSIRDLERAITTLPPQYCRVQ